MAAGRQVQLPVSEHHIASMFDKIANRYDFLNALLSLKQDSRWRKHLVRSVPYRPEGTFLDVATGTGDVIIAAAAAHPEYKNFIGVDISTEMLSHAQQKIRCLPEADQIQFHKMSAESLDFAEASADCLSISFGLRNVINREGAIKEFFRVLRPAGSLLVLEFFLPKRGLLGALFQIYFHNILPVVAGLFSDKKAYSYLPQSVGGFYTRKELVEKLSQAGFIDIRIKAFLFGSCCLVSARKS